MSYEANSGPRWSNRAMPDGERSREVLTALAASAESLAKARYLPLVVALSTIVLALPALNVGWILDDYYHRAVLLQAPRFRDLLGPPSEMFRFFRGDPARMGRLMDIGLFPWWTDPNIKGEFLQALTVLTHRLDY